MELLETIAQVFEMSVIALLSFDEKAAFTHCTGAMSVNGNNTYNEGSTALVTELKAHIEDLKAENGFLRDELKAARPRK